MTEKFPIQQQTEPGIGGNVHVPRGEVPWEVADIAYKSYSARYGTSQSLERLAERAGFGWEEFAEHLLEGMQMLRDEYREQYRRAFR